MARPPAPSVSCASPSDQKRASRQKRQRAFLLDAKPFWVLREYHDTAGEHQQTDYLEQHYKVIFIGHAK
jgi:hypothetical protein